MKNNAKANSIFNGTSELIGKFFSTEGIEKLKQKTTYRRLSDPKRTVNEYESLCRDLYKVIENNRSKNTASIQNWRSARQTRLSENNRSQEVLLERAIAILGNRGKLSEWTNQVPVASGLVDSSSDKRAAIDLVRLKGNEATLVELKWKTDTPVFASLEMLRYGLAYLYCYVHKDELGYQDKPLMQVKKVSLWVLAPRDYFPETGLEWLVHGLNKGICALADKKTKGDISMNFRFMAFPDHFELPFKSASKVNALNDQSQDNFLIPTFVSALSNIESVW